MNQRLSEIEYQMKLLAEDVATVIIEEFPNKKLIGKIHPDAGFLPSEKFKKLVDEIIEARINDIKNSTK